MIGRTGELLFLVVIFSSAAPAYAQQAATSGAHATIQCESQSYVPVTADEEQSMPFHLVDKAACGSHVTVLSDPQGYTVRVRTAAGKIGYVARYQLAIEPDAKRAAAAAAIVRNDPEPAEPATASAKQNGQGKPRVYVSDTESWNASGGFTRASSVAPGALYGGYNPDLTDIYQDFTSDCSITVTQKKTEADFVVLFDKGTPKKGFTGLHGLVKVNKVTVLSKSGATVVSETARSEDVAVSVACNAVSQPASGAASNAAHQSSQ